VELQAIAAFSQGVAIDPSALAAPQMPAPLMSAGADTASPFGQLVSQGLDKLNGDLVASQVDMQRLAAGDAPDLHRIMVHLEETQLSFQLMMQVRSRLLDAYQDVMKMSV
jgi:flagellar hook-basal body complex protein FliE